MFGKLFARSAPGPATVHVEPFGWTFEVEAGQTILQAALARGLPWPSRCRAGSCTTCRCRLLDGDVQRLTVDLLVTGDRIDVADDVGSSHR